jgi:methylated-DNA-protein-cysteine methyltransferase-like protein
MTSTMGAEFTIVTSAIACCVTLWVVPKPDKNLFRSFLAQIRKIPRGKVATYGDVAYAAGYPGYARQVAWALHGSGGSVPWQRVVGADGKILLTGEYGFEQRMRLQNEGVSFIGLRVDLKAHHHSFFANKKSRAKKKR